MATAPPGPTIHFCCEPGCGSWGAFGEPGPRDGDGKPTTVWRCFAHWRAREEAQQRADAAPRQAGPAGRQGTLL